MTDDSLICPTDLYYSITLAELYYKHVHPDAVDAEKLTKSNDFRVRFSRIGRDAYGCIHVKLNKNITFFAFVVLNKVL